MTTHSVPGYAATVKLRSRATVLVEGETDKRVVGRTVLEFAERGMTAPDIVVVDSSDLIRPDSTGIGRREVVEFVHHHVGPDCSRFAALVDREFRAFAIKETVTDDAPHEAIRHGSLFWTRGHSIENYFFDVEYVLGWLVNDCHEHCTHECRNRLRSQFDTIVRWAAAVSLALKEAELLQRADGVARRDMWLDVDGKLLFDVGALTGALAARGADEAKLAQVAASVSEAYDRLGTPSEVSRWVAHGHIGWSLIWTATASIMANGVTDESVTDGIAHGFANGKMRQFASRFAAGAAEGAQTSLGPLWTWIKGTSEMRPGIRVNQPLTAFPL